MTRRWKTALGVATAWPLIYVVLYFLFAFWVFFSTAGSSDVPPHVASAQSAASAVNVVTILLTLALTIFYVVLISTNEAFSSSQKTAWVIVVLAGSIAGMLVYWYLFIHRESEAELGVLGVGFRMAAERRAREAREAEEARDSATTH